jgi:hypothetical protein
MPRWGPILGDAVTESPLPRLDDARERLAAGFGVGIGSWFDELPGVLSALAQSWQLEFSSLIPRGSMSVAIRCRVRGGRHAILKIGPDRARLANEAAALDRWTTLHTPSVLAVDVSVGGAPDRGNRTGNRAERTPFYPELERVAELLTALHEHGVSEPSFPPLSHRVAHLFDGGTRPYTRHPELLEVIAPQLYERGDRLAARLADDASPASLLGDLTPSNILDGGEARVTAATTRRRLRRCRWRASSNSASGSTSGSPWLSCAMPVRLGGSSTDRIMGLLLLAP